MQRGRKNRNYRPDSTGSNVLFTLGLISVVALLIVGWVMTRGGFDSFDSESLREKGTKIISILNPSPTPVSAAVPAPTPTVMSITTIATAPPNPNLQEAIQNLTAQYEQKLKQQQEESQKQMENMRLKYQSQIDEYKKKIMLLEMENQSLRGEQ